MPLRTLAVARFRAQRLAATALARPEDAVAWLGAVQAQDHLGGPWSAGPRLRAATDASVEAALAGKAVARTWLLRGTLHLIAAGDLRWPFDLVGPRAAAATARRRAGTWSSAPDRGSDAAPITGRVRAPAGPRAPHGGGLGSTRLFQPTPASPEDSP